MANLRVDPPIVIIGGGLAGSCTALALAAAGVRVILIEQDHQAMNRASLRNEGKIHLGFVYANDASMATGRLMLEGALSFRPIMRELLGDGFEEIGVSTPFDYLVAKDSIVDAERLESCYDDLDTVYQTLKGDGPDYLGTEPDHLYRRLAKGEWTSSFSPDVVAAAFETKELAIDTDDLARVVRRALLVEERIDLRTEHRVEEIETRTGGYMLSGQSPEGTFLLEAEQVVNATWERRSALDSQLGIEPEEGLLHRLKYRLIGELPVNMIGGRSATMVLGRYGDVVVRPNGTAFLSWYPVGLRGWSSGPEPPRAWDNACRGNVDPAVRDELADAMINEIQRWYPAIGRIRPLLVDAGAIVAVGLTDIDDPGSQLHKRTHIGVTSLDGYHSLQPGKLTTAPMYACEAMWEVLKKVGRGVHRRPFSLDFMDRLEQ